MWIPESSQNEKVHGLPISDCGLLIVDHGLLLAFFPP
jgi:hypothetical protein